MKDLEQELLELKINQGIIERRYCTMDEEKEYEKLRKEGLLLPDIVQMEKSGRFVRYYESSISEEDVKELLSLRKLEYEKTQVDYLIIQADHLKSIKNNITFFAILIKISLVISAIILILYLINWELL